MTYQVTFEERNLADKGKIVLLSTREGGDDATVNLYVNIIDPSGSYVVQKNLSVPNAAVTTPSTLKFNIPLDSSGEPMRGTYTFEFTIEQTVTTPGTKTVDQSFTHYYKWLGNNSSLAWEETCVAGAAAILKLVDSGDYSQLTMVSRELKIIYPPQEQLPDLTGAGTQLSILPRWVNVTYMGSLDSEYYNLTATNADVNVYERYDIQAQANIDFTCGNCNLSSCIAAYAKKLGTNPGPADYQKLQLLSIYLEAYKGAIGCGNTEDAALFSSKIEEILDCDCGCSDNPTSAPIEFDNSLLDDVIGTQGAPGAWTLFTDADLQGSWVTESYANEQLRWRRIGDAHIEIIGRAASTGLTSGLGTTLLTGYFAAQGIALQPYMTHSIMLVENNGLSSIRFGGHFFVSYSGSNDTFTLYVSNDVTPVSLAGFSIHAFIPIQ